MGRSLLILFYLSGVKIVSPKVALGCFGTLFDIEINNVCDL